MVERWEAIIAGDDDSVQALFTGRLRSMKKIFDEEALRYHEEGRRGKIEVVPTKSTVTQRDLSLAYSPGVAVPCLEIARNPIDVYRYTAKGNLVGVISNGTAVLGLGNIGALASKPVMEGKGVLFKRFADLDVFDIEIDEEDPEAFIATVKRLEPTFGAINLEDIKAPESFEIESRLQAEMNIPVFHDDQHGTAIISGAALLNALQLTGRKIEEAKVIFSGAGAAAIGVARLWVQLGVRKENMILTDSKGVIYRGRSERMDPTKEEFAAHTDRRTLAEAMAGADVLVGLSVAGIVSAEMLRSMAADPIVFALANPDPEIGYDEAKAARRDVIVATGRSDYPNQVNNVLGFPFIFRGALDVRATQINDQMKLACVHALAELAKEDVPDSVLKAYDRSELRFGREYLIPKPLDSRVLLRVPPAVARAAMKSGVAQQPIEDFHAYERRLERIISRRLDLMRDLKDRARSNPKRVVFPEGEHEKILRTAKILVDEGIARPILLARRERILPRLAELDLSEEAVEIIEVADARRSKRYAAELHQRRRRDGLTREAARDRIRSKNYFATMMVELGEADGLISGLTHNYSHTIRPALEVIGVGAGFQRVSGAFVLALKDRVLFLADTTVNIEPTAQDLAEIAIQTARLAKNFVRPRVAMISFSDFGSNTHPSARRMRRATAIAKQRAAELSLDIEIDGEMQADTAIVRSIMKADYPWSDLSDAANVLVFPELNSANAAYKLIWGLTDAEAMGPILLGMAKPVHVLQRSAEVTDIVNMATFCVVEAQMRGKSADEMEG